MVQLPWPCRDQNSPGAEVVLPCRFQILCYGASGDAAPLGAEGPDPARRRSGSSLEVRDPVMRFERLLVERSESFLVSVEPGDRPLDHFTKVFQGELVVCVRDLDRLLDVGHAVSP